MAFLPQSPLRLVGLGIAAGWVAFAGCDSSGGSSVSVTHPTMIRVEPEDFIGSVPCNLDGPGLKRYVATIIDRNYGEGGAPGTNELGAGGAEIPQGGAEGFVAPSSLPTPCTTGVGFGFVVPGRRYEVFIDAYDTDALTPRAAGSPQMMPTDAETDPAHTLPVKPRWQTKCRRAVAVDSTVVRADQCTPFELDGATTTGQLRVALGGLLGALSCGADESSVDTFEVKRPDPSGAGTLVQTFPCSSDAQVELDGAAGAKLALYVTAKTASGTVLAGTQCNGVIKAGASVDATCTALSRTTTLQVDVNAALKQLGKDCGTVSGATVTVTPVGVPGSAPRTLPASCMQPLLFGYPPGVPPLVTVSASFAVGTELKCFGDSLPGQIVPAACE